MGLSEKKYILKDANGIFYKWNGYRLDVYGDFPKSEYAVSAIELHYVSEVENKKIFKYKIMPYEIKVEIGTKVQWDNF